MKKLKRIVILTLLLLSFLTTQKVLANNSANLLEKMEYTEEFKNYLKLPEEEKKKVIMPRLYEIDNNNYTPRNPLYMVKRLKASSSPMFSLRDIIPNNIIIKNQQNTSACWAFATLSALETNLALANYRNGNNLSKIYDFSERHMEYATSKMFANNVENKTGYNRQVGEGGNYAIASSYLTNGIGAIPELEMPFENNEDIIDISQIQNKTISSQVNDTVFFANYRNKESEEKLEIMNTIKQHIQNNGAVYASIHGNSTSTLFECYNNTTGAKFCDTTFFHGTDHAVSIIGWDDNYSIDNFSEEAKPEANGAWIVRNSWGEKAEDWKLSELKDYVFNNYRQQCINRGWNTAQEVPNSFIEESGYTIENDTAYIIYGDNGIIYVSYEDVNISKDMFGITKAIDTLDYDNIYQYDEFYPAMELTISSPKMMVCNIFNKKTTGPEYLTQLSLTVPETYTCKVYVNPNGSSKAKDDLQPVTLKAGETETINAGYHTLEFSEPIEIKANTFAVAVEIQASGSRVKLLTESIVEEVETWNSVTVENEKCFVNIDDNLDDSEWMDLGRLKEINSSLCNGDSSIKAFTTNTLLDNSLKNIEIVTPPTKTSYFEGENFDTTGMVIKANYNSKTNPSSILDSASYNITNGTNLQVGQTSVTISYEDKSVSQTINVERNTVESLEIKTPPAKTEYKEGENFDATGMVIEATYKDGTTKQVNDYTLENAYNLKADQTEVTILYGEKTIKQNIIVIPNPLIEIKVTKEPDKTRYVVGQNFNKIGMIVTGIYQDESTHEIVEYTVENGTNLTKQQESVTIEYKGKTTTQAITVEEKMITSISIDGEPSKLTYIQNTEVLDLSGGNLKILYNDESYENIPLTSEEVSVTGFDNKTIGSKTITITYKTKTTQLEVQIVETDKAENSNFNDIKCTVEKVQAYYYKEDSKKDYTLINIIVDEFTRSLKNDKVEYYYYLSSNKDEQNINEWVKIPKGQSLNNKLQFTIDSRQISNYNELSNENVLYLYIKEVAQKGGNQSIAISKSMKVETNSKIETYIDNAKVDNFDSWEINQDDDSTIAKGILPQTGTVSVAIFIIITFAIGSIFYFRYKKLSKYVK